MSNETTVELLHNVVVDSIGTATPSVATVLADALGTPVEVVANALYNAPCVLFTDVAEELAETTVKLLAKLGIDAHTQLNDQPLPLKQDPVDIGVYVNDIDKLADVTAALSHFLGCSNAETLQLLMNDPAIVLGGVSRATGDALTERIDAEIIISNPKEDLYTLVFKSENRMIQSQLEAYLKYAEISYDFSANTEIRDLTYETANTIWSKFHATGMLKMMNQSFQRYEIILDAVDENNPNFRTKLAAETGMPDEIIDHVIENLPVQIEASVNHKSLQEKLTDYAQNGLTCSPLMIKQNGYKLIIEENANLAASKTILSQFLEEDALPDNGGRWESPVTVSDLIFRCVSTQLEAVGCTVDYEFS